MSLTTCEHKENVQKLDGDKRTNGSKDEVGLCSICGQVRKVTDGKTSITKLGRINGLIVKPDPDYLLAVNAQDTVDFQDAFREPKKTASSVLVEKTIGTVIKEPAPIKETLQAEFETTAVQTQSPVPPRPDTTGLDLHKKLVVIGAYYDANKEAIIKEWEAAGRPKQLKRWGMSYSSLQGELQKWGALPKPDKKQRAAAKEAIIKDYQTMKLLDFSAKWRIWSGTWMVLKARWKVANKHLAAAPETKPSRKSTKIVQKRTETVSKAETDEKAEADRKAEFARYLKENGLIPGSESPLPEGMRVVVIPMGARVSPLPPWNDAWSPEVQIKWLECYKEAARGV
jgi:hypothetical protein